MADELIELGKRISPIHWNFVEDGKESSDDGCINIHLKFFSDEEDSLQGQAGFFRKKPWTDKTYNVDVEINLEGDDPEVALIHELAHVMAMERQAGDCPDIVVDQWNHNEKYWDCFEYFFNQIDNLKDRLEDHFEFIQELEEQ